MPRLPPDLRRRLILLGTAASLLVGLIGTAALYQRYLRTQVTTPLTASLRLDARPPGQYRLLYDARTTAGQALHAESSFTVQAPPPSPAPSPLPTPTPLVSPSATPVAAASGPVLATFDSHVSSAPINILATWEGYGPATANLTMTGTSQETPSFTVEAPITYQNGTWQIGAVTTTNLPSGYSPPQFLTDTGSRNGYGHDTVAVKSGNGEAYRMTWTMRGTASSTIGPVVLPRMYTAPWRGQLAGMVIKGRHTPATPADNAPYGAHDANLRERVDGLIDAIRRMSNGLAQLTYTVEESTFTIPPEMTQCSMMPISDQLVRNLGITDRTGRYAWLIPTLYESTLTAFSGGRCDIPQGLTPNFHGYPLSGPGAWQPNIRWPNEQLSHTVLLHEFGHGIGLSHPHVNTRCLNPRRDEVRVQDLFGNCGSPAGTPDSVMGPYNTYWLHPIDRATVGWLTGAQVKLVTSSGTYDVYSDNDDFTSDPTKPLILQLLVMVNGKSDFAYVTVPNAANIAALPGWSQEHKAHYVSGVQLSGGGDLRGGISNAAISINTYTFETQPHTTLQLYRHVIPAGQSVRLRWPGTDITLNVLSRTHHHARVQVTYH